VRFPRSGAAGPPRAPDRRGMERHVDRAEARLLDHCTSFGRWLDEGTYRPDASGRLRDTLDTRTLATLQRGLGSHPYLTEALNVRAPRFPRSGAL
jgi:hypothetical protein